MLHFSTFESNSRLIPLDQPSTILQENNIKRSDKNPLILKLETFVNANLHNEQFGVEQLAEMMGMSRSHLHRKLHKVKGKSISRFIREYRLEAARKMLIEKEMTASEVSHAVGFGSPSYFNKCFTEYFGYSPGKARLKVDQEITRNTESKSSKNKIFLWLSGLAAAILIGFLIFSQNKKEAVMYAGINAEDPSIPRIAPHLRGFYTHFVFPACEIFLDGEKINLKRNEKIKIAIDQVVIIKYKYAAVGIRIFYATDLHSRSPEIFLINDGNRYNVARITVVHSDKKEEKGNAGIGFFVEGEDATGYNSVKKFHQHIKDIQFKVDIKSDGRMEISKNSKIVLRFNPEKWERTIDSNVEHILNLNGKDIGRDILKNITGG